MDEVMEHLQSALSEKAKITDHLWRIDDLRIFAMHNVMAVCSYLIQEKVLSPRQVDKLRLRLEEKFELNTSGIREVKKP